MTTPHETLRRLAVSFYAAPADCDLEHFCTLLAARDIGGVGLTARAVQTHTPQRLTALLKNHELTCVSLNSAGYFLHDDRQTARSQAELDNRLLACAAALDAPVNVITGGLGHMGGGTRPRTLERARARVGQRLAELWARAEREGARLSLEPIHPLGIADKGCINQLSHARETIATLPGTGLTLDLYHSWWDAELENTITLATADLAVVQLCGVQLSGAAGIPKRTHMGGGIADVGHVLSLLDVARYPGLLEYEVFFDQIDTPTVEALLDRAVVDYLDLAPS